MKPQDFDRLSAYIDDQLSPDEKAALEARLGREPELRAALLELRLTVRTLRALPAVKPPRSFTLSAEQASLALGRRRSLFPTLRLAAALSSVALALVLVVDFAGLRGVAAPLAAPAGLPEGGDASARVAQVTEEAAAESASQLYDASPAAQATPAPTVEAQAEPMITLAQEATAEQGTGSAGTGAAGTELALTQETTDPAATPQNGGDAPTATTGLVAGNAATEAPVEPPAETPAAADPAATPEASVDHQADAQPTPTEARADTEESLRQFSVVTETPGKVYVPLPDTSSDPDASPSLTSRFPPVRLIEAGLAALTVVLALAAWLVRRG